MVSGLSGYRMQNMAQLRNMWDTPWLGHPRTKAGNQKFAEWVKSLETTVSDALAPAESARARRTDRAISSLPRLVRLARKEGEEGVQCSARTETAEATTTTTATRMMKLLGGGRSSRANDDDDDDNGCRL